MNRRNNILAIILFIIFGIGTSYYYYSGAAHSPAVELLGESVMPYAWYLLLCFLPIGIPMILQSIDSKKFWSIGVGSIGLSFIWILLITCIFTTARYGFDVKAGTYAAIGISENIGGVIGAGFGVFFRILGYLILPIALILVSLGLGTRVLWMLKISAEFDGPTRLGLWVVTGFAIYTTLLSLIGIWWYSLGLVYILMAVAVILSYKDIWKSIREIASYKHSLGNGNIFSTFSHIISGGLLTITWIIMSVNFVNILRPFPIGWDDLGVYMNFPKIIASSGSTLYFGMSFWQNFVGVGFLHGSASLAFFLNSVGGILAVIMIFLGIRFLLSRYEKDEKIENTGGYLMSLPLLAATAYMAMPMVVFQLAKDMKVDSGLLAISIAALIFLFAALESKSRSRTLLLVLSGLLMGVAFATKFTTLMLILGGLAMIWYAQMRIRGFVMFISIFVVSFTVLGLWKFLNISLPPLSVTEMILFSLSTIGIASGLYLTKLTSISREALLHRTKLILADSILLVLAIVVALAPWIIKNSVEVFTSPGSTLTVGTLLNGQPKSFTPDMLQIISAERIKEIDAKFIANALDADGNTKNEDLGRYFGYEKGISNYLKLPINLTLQSNQWGEFTDIGPLYLALLPGVFLLLLSTFQARIIGFSIFIILAGLYFLPIGQLLLTTIASQIQLPLGYLVVILLGFIPIGLISLSEKQEKRLNPSTYGLLSAFLGLYILLFVLAAFGIVWYGIVLYFGLLAVITLGLSIIMSREALKSIVNICLSAGIILWILIPYLFWSVLVQAWNNMPEDLPEYRQGAISEEEAIFLSRPEYVPLLETLNLQTSEAVRANLIAAAKTPEIKALLETYKSDSLKTISDNLGQAQRLVLGGGTSADTIVSADARAVRNILFKQLLYPPKESVNTGAIYRVGTFTTYYVARNRERFYEDSLIYQFDSYLEGKDREESIDHLEKLGAKYLLLDLNAATIDRDPRKDLTRRFEGLLDLVRSPRLELITTDSPCLELALRYRSDENFLRIAGVNYDSYARDKNGVLVLDSKWRATGESSWTKQKLCLKAMSAVVTEDVLKSLTPRIGRSYMAAFRIVPRTGGQTGSGTVVATPEKPVENINGSGATASPSLPTKK